MDKRSFFRGFGIGVLFAAVILGVSFMVRTSDSFTKQRAVELGMVYPGGDSKTVLSSEQTSSKEKDASQDASKDNTENKNSDKKNNEKKNAESTKEKETKSESKSSSKKTSKDNSAEMKKEKEKLEKNVKKEQQKLTIHAKEWSTEVSQKLKQMGIIDDAKKFDKYLDKSGYSSAIKAGTYKISLDDSYEDIAKKITGKK